jgi:RimJ/RimL family protein N-acetyltransferase
MESQTFTNKEIKDEIIFLPFTNSHVPELKQSILNDSEHEIFSSFGEKIFNSAKFDFTTLVPNKSKFKHLNDDFLSSLVQSNERKTILSSSSQNLTKDIAFDGKKLKRSSNQLTVNWEEPLERSKTVSKSKKISYVIAIKTSYAAVLNIGFLQLKIEEIGSQTLINYFYIAKAFRRKDYEVKALQALLEFQFNTLNMRKTIFWVYENNYSFIAMMNSLKYLIAKTKAFPISKLKKHYFSIENIENPISESIRISDPLSYKTKHVMMNSDREGKMEMMQLSLKNRLSDSKINKSTYISPNFQSLKRVFLESDKNQSMRSLETDSKSKKQAEIKHKLNKISKTPLKSKSESLVKKEEFVSRKTMNKKVNLLNLAKNRNIPEIDSPVKLHKPPPKNLQHPDANDKIFKAENSNILKSEIIPKKTKSPHSKIQNSNRSLNKNMKVCDKRDEINAENLLTHSVNSTLAHEDEIKHALNTSGSKVGNEKCNKLKEFYQKKGKKTQPFASFSKLTPSDLPLQNQPNEPIQQRTLKLKKTKTMNNMLGSMKFVKANTQFIPVSDSGLPGIIKDNVEVVTNIKINPFQNSHRLPNNVSNTKNIMGMNLQKTGILHEGSQIHNIQPPFVLKYSENSPQSYHLRSLSTELESTTHSKIAPNENTLLPNTNPCSRTNQKVIQKHYLNNHQQIGLKYKFIHPNSYQQPIARTLNAIKPVPLMNATNIVGSINTSNSSNLLHSMNGMNFVNSMLGALPPDSNTIHRIENYETNSKTKPKNSDEIAMNSVNGFKTHAKSLNRLEGIGKHIMQDPSERGRQDRASTMKLRESLITKTPNLTNLTNLKKEVRSFSLNKTGRKKHEKLLANQNHYNHYNQYNQYNQYNEYNEYNKYNITPQFPQSESTHPQYLQFSNTNNTHKIITSSPSEPTHSNTQTSNHTHNNTHNNTYNNTYNKNTQQNKLQNKLHNKLLNKQQNKIEFENRMKNYNEYLMRNVFNEEKEGGNHGGGKNWKAAEEEGEQRRKVLNLIPCRNEVGGSERINVFAEKEKEQTGFQRNTSLPHIGNRKVKLKYNTINKNNSIHAFPKNPTFIRKTGMIPS